MDYETKANSRSKSRSRSKRNISDSKSKNNNLDAKPMRSKRKISESKSDSKNNRNINDNNKEQNKTKRTKRSESRSELEKIADECKLFAEENGLKVAQNCSVSALDEDAFLKQIEIKPGKKCCFRGDEKSKKSLDQFLKRHNMISEKQLDNSLSKSDFNKKERQDIKDHYVESSNKLSERLSSMKNNDKKILEQFIAAIQEQFWKTMENVPILFKSMVSMIESLGSAAIFGENSREATEKVKSESKEADTWSSKMLGWLKNFSSGASDILWKGFKMAASLVGTATGKVLGYAWTLIKYMVDFFFKHPAMAYIYSELILIFRNQFCNYLSIKAGYVEIVERKSGYFDNATTAAISGYASSGIDAVQKISTAAFTAFLPEFTSVGLGWAKGILQLGMGSLTTTLAVIPPFGTVIAGAMGLLTGSFTDIIFGAVQKGAEVLALKNQISGSMENLIKFFTEPCLVKSKEIKYVSRTKSSKKRGEEREERERMEQEERKRQRQKQEEEDANLPWYQKITPKGVLGAAAYATGPVGGYLVNQYLGE